MYSSQKTKKKKEKKKKKKVMGEEQCTICSLVGERYYRTQKVKPWRWSSGPFMTRVDQACHSMGGSFYSATVSTERFFLQKKDFNHSENQSWSNASSRIWSCCDTGEEKQRNEMKATISRDKFWRDGMEELQPFPLL